MDFLLHGDSFDVLAMAVAMLAGLALFLLGMEQISQALQALAGGGLGSLLERVTANRFRALLTGGITTALVQSSSVTTVLMVGFVSAGAATLAQAIGFILGADIGSTVTAQLIAFKITAWSLPLIVVGYFTHLLAPRESWKFIGLMTMALGLIFFGLEIMAHAMHPLRSWEPFMQLMRGMDNPLLGIAVGAVFTALIQSSAASMGIFIVLAGQGFLSLEAGLGLVLGANVGTCATALLAAIGRPRAGVQVALAHILIKLLGVVAWLALLGQLAWLARLVSPAHPELAGLARVAAETPRQLANAHTLFNVINSLVLLGFTAPLARLVRVLLPDQLVPTPAIIKPRYLDDSLLTMPEPALERVRLELARMAELVRDMVARAAPVALSGTPVELAQLAAADDDIDRLHAATLEYLVRLSRASLAEAQTQRIHHHLFIADNLERMADTVETNLVALGRERIAAGMVFHPEACAALQPIVDLVNRSAADVLAVLEQDQPDSLQRLLDSEQPLNEMAQEIRLQLTSLLGVGSSKSLAELRLESDIISAFKRICYLARRIALRMAQLG